MKILGFDPGGGDKFGCSILDCESGYAEVWSASSVDSAMEWATGHMGPAAPSFVGIDTLLFWQSTRSGWRGADLYLRKRYPACRNSVLSANGLYGSMAVQGAVLAFRLRSAWPDVPLTETHPKVLWHHFNAALPYPRNWLETQCSEAWLNLVGIKVGVIANEDEFDALISAWAAWQVIKGVWIKDLTGIRAPTQKNDNVSLVPAVHYYWPD